jgi:hypothetical protein
MTVTISSGSGGFKGFSEITGCTDFRITRRFVVRIITSIVAVFTAAIRQFTFILTTVVSWTV